MPIYNEEITLQSTKLREFFNITPNLKAAVEKSGFSDGLIVVSSLHSNSAVFVNDDEPGLLQDLEAWLDQMAPASADYKHQGRFESTVRGSFAGAVTESPGDCRVHREAARLGAVAIRDLCRLGRTTPQANPGESDGGIIPGCWAFAGVAFWHWNSLRARSKIISTFAAYPIPHARI